jgi:hypothetical protein
MVGKGSQRGLGLPSLWLACELRAISVLIARFGVTCPYRYTRLVSLALLVLVAYVLYDPYIRDV